MSSNRYVTWQFAWQDKKQNLREWLSTTDSVLDKPDTHTPLFLHESPSYFSVSHSSATLSNTVNDRWGT